MSQAKQLPQDRQRFGGVVFQGGVLAVLRLALEELDDLFVVLHLVLDELATFGRVWCELNEKSANEKSVLELIANGGFNRPMRVIVFNTAEGWSRDDTVAVGLKLLQMSHDGRMLGAVAREFVERTTGQVPTLLA